jgi:hypothetical protein
MNTLVNKPLSYTLTKLDFELTMRMVVLLAINHAQLVRVTKYVE